MTNRLRIVSPYVMHLDNELSICSLQKCLPAAWQLVMRDIE